MLNAQRSTLNRFVVLRAVEESLVVFVRVNPF